MNPESGVLHAVAAIAGADVLADAERAGRGRRVNEVEDSLKRALRTSEARLKMSTEPPVGTEVPADWPRFSIGDKVGPIKGWWFEIVDVDVETQEMMIRPFESAKRTRTRCKRKRRRKR